MKPDELVVPPPIPKIIPYPGAIGVAFIILFTAILLIISGRFDPTGGVLTLSILVSLAFIGVVVFCLFFTVPNDEITSGVLGGLIASFGAVIAHWLGRDRKGPPNAP
jgi:uncharacterized BrkB/YihY/UPF0761 family membrane protein